MASLVFHLPDTHCAFLGIRQQEWSELGYNVIRLHPPGFSFFGRTNATYSCVGQERFVPLKGEDRIVSTPSPLVVQKEEDSVGFFPTWATQYLTIKADLRLSQFTRDNDVTFGAEKKSYYQLCVDHDVSVDPNGTSFFNETIVQTAYDPAKSEFTFKTRPEWQQRGVLVVDFFPHNIGTRFYFLERRNNTDSILCAAAL